MRLHFSSLSVTSAKNLVLDGKRVEFALPCPGTPGPDESNSGIQDLLQDVHPQSTRSEVVKTNTCMEDQLLHAATRTYSNRAHRAANPYRTVVTNSCAGKMERNKDRAKSQHSTSKPPIH